MAEPNSVEITEEQEDLLAKVLAVFFIADMKKKGLWPGSQPKEAFKEGDD